MIPVRNPTMPERMSRLLLFADICIHPEIREPMLAPARMRVSTLAPDLEGLIRAEADPERLRGLITTMVASTDELAICAAIAALGES